MSNKVYDIESEHQWRLGNVCYLNFFYHIQYSQLMRHATALSHFYIHLSPNI